ncbi:MAG: hypothetical protein V7K69_00080 [Nostoc sp.]|uniref:hypothetical protein n=1 Tax=Nostoc sp. TaxID=1180 RepID=UPI002FF9986B
MNLNWFEPLPFIFSILIKFGSNSSDAFLHEKLVTDIPQDYTLLPDHKDTIAEMAVDASQRVTYIISLFVTFVSAVVLATTKNNPNASIISVFLLALVGVYSVFQLIKPLGWLRVKIKFLGIRRRRNFWLTLILISFDFLLMIITIIPSVK